jgi:hypothetical protein
MRRKSETKRSVTQAVTLGIPLNHQPKQKMKTKNMTTIHLRNSIHRSSRRGGFVLIGLALAWFAVSPAAQALLPPPAPDGGYPNNNTAEGNDALFSLTTGSFNTATGESALNSNTAGSNNTATGAGALEANTIGKFSTATGIDALNSNTSGNNNTANGGAALEHNTMGSNNTATGVVALESNTTGNNNTANGVATLEHNTTGSNNVALGFNAGVNLTTGSNNIDIGNAGLAGEAAKIRIGKQGTQNGTFIAGIFGVPITGSTVVVNSSGKLGVATSSARFKDAIKPMADASEAILALKPVTFRYKHELDPDGIRQFGLVAEQVEKVNPDLVARDAEGKVYTVRYEAVNAMLLNEFLKQHRKVQQLEATAAQQQKEIRALTASVKEQASRIEKVSAQLELNKPAPQMVANNQ